MKNPDWLDFILFSAIILSAVKYLLKKEKLGGVLAFLFQFFWDYYFEALITEPWLVRIYSNAFL